jgi:2-alkyl-3-oxoalkanoate reductase
VIGRALLPALVAAGHEVTATTTSPEKAALLRSLGATPSVLDALDEQAVLAAVRTAAPEVVMNQLTRLPQRYDPRKLRPWYERTSRLRVDGTRHLLAAARDVGARRFINQSVAFLYALTGPPAVDEDAPMAIDAPEPFGSMVRAILEGERLTLEAEGIPGVVLRYGWLYGPGTYFAPGGDFARQARQRRVPIVGGGGGVVSFLHVDDAASATVCAMIQGHGVYNVVDDDPAPGREWIPVFAQAVGAPRPLRVPRWLARLMVGSWPAATLTEGRGASNRRARSELGWRPRRTSWRDELGRD